ncbi:transketolase [Sphingopyxis sp. SE2]|uniref:transketolase n=1 Tax=Sphingopyxis sp. SE2 TaxID=1586240 RepID=UPI0028C2EF5A|nr:transketolase [Sphingopyxis sp. SE2]MDT7531222.1 transketolase [Sphingopyxis sp. SE2]
MTTYTEELAPSVHDDSSSERLAIDTIRTLAMDAVQRANSGHPGTPMALAPIGFKLWRDYLRYDPTNPDWANRDRFVLSVGHASMLLYGLLHLAAVQEIDAEGNKTGEPAVSLNDIKNFRQIGSKTPGHPEYRITTGVETTTGPLGQGCGNSVGMAIAAQALASRFNRPGFDLFDFDVYVFCSDGDMMEGVAQEAASLAGQLALPNLCWIYDDNHVTIEGKTMLAFSEDVGKKFEAYGWQVIHLNDANDTQAFGEAIERFKATDEKPTMIIVHSIIGYGSPIEGTSKAHSDAMGEDVIRATKKAYGWPEDAQFRVPEEAMRALAKPMRERGGKSRQNWDAMFARYREQYAELAEELERARRGELPDGWDEDLPSFDPDEKGIASREASGKVLNAIAPHVSLLMGGAADLSPSTKTNLKYADVGAFGSGNLAGRNMHFGVREHAMGAIANGMALSYMRSYTGTFLVFLDYMRPPVRLAAIMEVPVIFVYTHDSIGVGEDGPTHQPIEHFALLRSTPGLDMIRPGDANETVEAWRVALSHTHEPTALIFSRQAIPTIDRSKYADASGLTKGAYVLASEGDDNPEIILIGTGSEMPLAVAAHEELVARGIKSRVVSMPSFYLFEKQDQAYKDSVFPPSVTARLAVEQGGEFGWDRYVGPEGKTITMSTFGASAPLKKLQEKFGFTVDHVVEVACNLLKRGD